MIDLHTHTLWSDGVLSPAELIRRAEVNGYTVIGLTDHADMSNIEQIIRQLLHFKKTTQEYFQHIRIIAGVELTHVPPAQIAGITKHARDLGAEIVVCHGETICEPVCAGTNRAAIEARVDILAHPGLITEEEVKRAAAHGVFLEISARSSHGLGNGRVAALARKCGAQLVIDSDSHTPGDILTPEWRKKVAFGAGIDAEELDKIDSTMRALADRILA